MTEQSIHPAAGGLSYPLDFALTSFLIVDDQPYTRRILRSILVGFGSREVYECANGTEALELARNATPSIIITDLMMPGCDGLRFIKDVKSPGSATANIPIIVLSGYLTKTTALAVNEAGAVELLVKPASPKALHEHIARLALRHSQANPSAAFGQNQRWRAEPQEEKPGELALA
jgi:two-component system chemotaxis response regulator CheY